MWRSKPARVFFPAVDSFQEIVWRPTVDIYQTRTGWVAKFDLAGVRLEDIRLQIDGRCLTVRGLRRDWLIEEGCDLTVCGNRDRTAMGLIAPRSSQEIVHSSRLRARIRYCDSRVDAAANLDIEAARLEGGRS